MSGSQLSLCRIAFTKSQIVSEMMPHLYRQGFPPKLNQSHHEENSNLNKLRAGLHYHRRIETTSSESGLEVDLGCKNRDVGEKLSSGQGPIDNLLDACTKHAREELFCLDVAIDRCAGQPFKVLVVFQLVILDDPS